MTTVRATVVQAPTPEGFEVLRDRTITVDDAGVITSVGEADPAAPVDVELDRDTVLLPGMIDTHVHAPQWPQLGTGLDLPLERWLFEYTFPLEARYADVGFAESVWAEMVPALLAHGTTTAVYHGSVHEPATAALAEACVRHGQRAFVGRVAMDHPEGTPDWYRDGSAAEAVAASARSIEAIRAIDDERGLVEPIITPRFIPACSDAALEGLGELAADTGVRVQTHCSESDWEHEYVLDRCGVTDAHALDRFGLVRDHTVLAHATHLSDDDRALLARVGAGVAHCPLSNVYFANRPFRARRAIGAGVRVGLGTDVAGGPSASLLGQCAHAVAASQRLVDGGEAHARITTATAMWMATAGGADLLGIDAGSIVPGRRFDAIAVRLPSPGDADLDDDALAERVVRLTERADVDRVWVDGREVSRSR